MTAAGNFLYTPDAWICGRGAVAACAADAKSGVKIAGYARAGGV